MHATELLNDEIRKKRTKERPVLEDMVMDITPMIDVVFQLLIFFMVAAKFKTLEGKMIAYLPKTEGIKVTETPPPEVLPVRVTLTWNVATRQAKVYVGQSFTGIADQGGLKVARRRVRQVLSTGVEKAEIDADPGIPYRYVVETLNMLIATRTKSISFAGRVG
jgi:biopolymer transport protein ExbD